MILLSQAIRNSTFQKRNFSVRWEVYIMFLLFIFSTAFSFAIGLDQRNYLIIGIMTVSCFIFLFTFKKYNSNEIYVYGFYFSLLLCLVKYPETFRGSTLSYTMMFAATFIVYIRILNCSAFRFKSYLKLIKIILFSYFFVLIIQQVCVFANVPIFNFILGDSSELKLNSLSPEPSHSARIVIFLFYSFICMRELELQRRYRLLRDGLSDRRVWFCFLYTMLTMGSSLAYLLLGLLLLRFVSVPAVFWGGGAILVLLLLPIQGFDIVPLDRALNFSSALLTSSPDNLAFVDHSASIRVLPIFHYLEQTQLFSFDFWFGKGIDYNIKIFPMLIHGVPEGTAIGGIFPTLFLNHGTVAGIFLVLMIYKNCLFRFISYSAFLGFVVVFACGLNTQIPWLVFMLLAANLFFEQNKMGARK